MDDESLYNKLVSMEEELRNLKTAHTHGVGAFSFYSKSASISIPGMIPWCHVTVEIEEGEPLPAFVQLLAPWSGSRIKGVISEGGRVFDWDYFTDNDVTFTAISASKIKSITLRAGS